MPRRWRWKRNGSDDEDITGDSPAFNHILGFALSFLRLDSLWVTEYVGLHGVCFSVIHCCLGRKSHNLWLGSAHAAQPMLIPEKADTAPAPSKSHTD